MAIAWLVFRENVDRRILLGAFAILAGAMLLSWQGGALGLGWGALLIAGACLAWGVDNNVTRKLSGADPVQIAMVKGLAAGAVNLGLPDAGCATAATQPCVVGRADRFSWLRRQPDAVRPRIAPSRNGTHWRIFLDGPIHRRRSRRRVLWRARDSASARRGASDGDRSLSASGRTTRPRARA